MHPDVAVDECVVFLTDLYENCRDLEKFKIEEGSVFLVTGASGQIGSTIVKNLLLISTKIKIKIIAVVRDNSKAIEAYAGWQEFHNLCFIECDISKGFFIEEEVNFIFHCASKTSSIDFVKNPVDTILTNFNGTLNLLEYSRGKQIKSFVYVSSIEVYGSGFKNEVSESDLGYLDLSSVRSSYPESKRMCENLCHAYMRQHDVPIKIARLTQIIGPGVAANDERATAHFAKKMLQMEDIVLYTSGSTTKNYCHTVDAVSALLHIAFIGENGGCYNVSSAGTEATIREVATKIAMLGKHTSVIVNDDSSKNKQFYPETQLITNSEKLESIGWKARRDLDGMINSLVCYMKFILKKND